LQELFDKVTVGTTVDISEASPFQLFP
jgi:hypothetical protein